MSILIKGIAMPKSCYECSLQDDECFGSIKCQYAKTWGSERTRAVDCPLILVPPHGRLIDADALTRAQGFHDYKYENSLMYVEVGEVVSLIKAAPTIIPASEEEPNGRA